MLKKSLKLCSNAGLDLNLQAFSVHYDVSFPHSTTITIPATSANLGPGYDCLGLAVDLHNRVTVTRNDFKVEQPPHAMVAAVAQLFFAQVEVQSAPFGFTWEIEGDVPRSRGLGSSVTVRLGILMGLNVLCGLPLSQQRLFEVCSESEGHPDNVGPAVFGGFVLCHGKDYYRFPVAHVLQVVIVIPDFEIETAHARSALPAQIPHADAVKNTNNACALVAAFASQNYARLSGTLEDYLHQPYRKHLIPCLDAVINAGKQAGALGGYLSGSGSTIACFSNEEKSSQQIADAMLEALRANGADGYSLILEVDNVGARVLF